MRAKRGRPLTSAAVFMAAAFSLGHAAAKDVTPPLAPFCAFGKSQELTIVSCQSADAFAAGYHGWVWREGVKDAVSYGNFAWDEAAKNLPYSRAGGELLLRSLGVGAGSTPAEKVAGREVALRLLTCAHAAELAMHYSDGDEASEARLFAEPAAVYLLERLRVPAAPVRRGLLLGEDRFRRAAAVPIARPKQATISERDYRAIEKTWRSACPAKLTRSGGIIVMTLAEQNNLRPNTSP